MDKVKIIKQISKAIVGFSVGGTVTQIVKNNASPTNTLEGVKVVVTGAVIGSMMAEASENWIDRKVDEVVVWFEKTKFNYSK